ncbi:MAG: hypothetical protein SAMD01599839_08130 [Rectinema sp.]
MKAKYFFLLVIALFVRSSSMFPPIRWIPVENETEVLSVYELAEIVTGAPADILRGIAITESNENDRAIGDDGISKGRMQINETFHDERAKKYGDYDPFSPLDAAIIAGYIFVENYSRLKDSDSAIAAHRQGVDGVRKYGPTKWYIDRVKDNL